MANGSGRKRVRWLRYVLMGVAGLGLYHILTGPSGAVNLLRLRKERADLEAGLDSLARRKQQLKVEKFRLERDSSYMEQVARRELGMARPDEKVYRFIRPKTGK